MMALIVKHSLPLKGFFSVAFLLLISAAIYLIRHRKKFFGYHFGDPGDTYASANLRMWMVILILIHAIVITGIMIFEV